MKPFQKPTLSQRAYTKLPKRLYGSVIPDRPRVARLAKLPPKPKALRPDVKIAMLQQLDGAEKAELPAHPLPTANHLIVLVHGLNGCSTNWNTFQRLLKSKIPNWRKTTAIYASHGNRRLKTFGGICSCAERLSDEVYSVIDQYPNLKHISFVVHSLGGLITRYACGRNYDPVTKTIFGLQPRHFVSIATPHLGCNVLGESQVPFLGWGMDFPIIGPLVIRPLVFLIAPFVMRYIYRRTGQQLFLLDGKDRHPLVCRMVEDVPTEGFFLSALKSFKSRTCYANVRHDALVSWANASIRRLSELPQQIEKALSKGIAIREDTVCEGLWTEFNDESRNFQYDQNHSVDYMLRVLQSLPWRRIDVRFDRQYIPLLAHSHIQVTRKVIDNPGLPVVDYICQNLVNAESLIDH